MDLCSTLPLGSLKFILRLILENATQDLLAYPMVKENISQLELRSAKGTL